MIVSLVVSAGLSALDTYLKSVLPLAHALMWAFDFVVSLGLLSLLFSAIYKILPDKRLPGRLAVGSVVTALLFTIGKSLIGVQCLAWVPCCSRKRA